MNLLRPQLSIHYGDEYGSRREYANDNDVDGLLGDDSDDIPLTQLGHRRHARQEMSWPSWPSSFASNPIGSPIPGTSRENMVKMVNTDTDRVLNNSLVQGVHL